jgi:hypothetical protein
VYRSGAVQVVHAQHGQEDLDKAGRRLRQRRVVHRVRRHRQVAGGMFHAVGAQPSHQRGDRCVPAQSQDSCGGHLGHFGKDPGGDP